MSASRNLTLRAFSSIVSRSAIVFRKSLPSFEINRSIYANIYYSRQQLVHTTPFLNLKEIKTTVTGNVTVIEGVNVPSDRVGHVINVHGPPQSCSLCRLNLDLQHTDVLILSQFVRDDGCLLPRRVTGLCDKQQRLVKALVAQAQKAGLMSNLTPFYSHKDPKKRYGWKKFNRYFEPEKSGRKTKVYM